MVDLKTAANVPAPAKDEVYAFPTTVGQKRFWALNSLAPGNPALNMPLAARLEGRLDREKFQAALDAVVHRHEILRSSFQAEDEDVVQVVHPSNRHAIHWIERPESTRERVTEATRELMHAEALKTLDLAKESQLRATIATFSPDEHLLMLTMHHIICDGWSNGILLRELAENYTRLSQGNMPPAEDLPLQYGDYAVWQKEWLASGEAAEQLAYWRSHLGEELPVLNLPTDRPRGPRPTFNGHIHTLLLPQETADGLRMVCQREKVTPFMLHLSAYVLLLHRYAGREDFVVGSPAANRNQTELEGMIGLFANPLLFRFKIDPTTTFRQLLAQVRDLSLANFGRQEYPFELIGEELRGERSHRGVPWLQAYFIFQKAFMQPQEMPGLHLTPLRSTSAGAMFEWMLGVLERNEGVRLQLEYNTDLFDLETIERALRHLEAILTASIRQPDFIIGDIDLNLATPVGFPENDDARSATTESSLLTKVSAAFGQGSEAILLAYRSARLSLGGLQTYTARIKELLVKTPVAPPARIAILSEDRLFALASAVAVCEAGHTAVLLPAIPASGPFDAILTGSISEPTLQTVSASSPATLRTSGLVLQNDLGTELITVGPIALAALGRQAESLATVLRIQARDCVLATAAIHTPLGWEEILAAWLRGACAVSDAECDEPPVLNASVLLLPSAWWEQMMQRSNSPWPAVSAKARLIALDRDPISPAVVNSLGKPATRVVQRFQPRSIGLTVAIQNLRPAGGNHSTGDSRIPAIWIDGWECQIADQRGIPCPHGVPGRLIVTARTGDFPTTRDPDGEWVRERNDGSLEWTGQAAGPDLLSAGNVELKEIADVAARHASVGSVCVVRGPKGDAQTWTWALHVTPATDGGVTPDDLKAFVAERLPGYMVPPVVAVHAKLPLTPAGRIDYQALNDPKWFSPPDPAISPSGLTASPETAAACNEIETRLSALFSELLHVPVTDMRRSFFDLGGHSLLGVKLFARIEKEFGQRLPLATLLSSSSVRGLARRLGDAGSGAAQWSCLVPIHTSGNGPVFFCVHGAGGNVLLYRELARHMAPDVRFYGLQARGLDGHSASQTKIEDMAELYLSEILAVQPHGPYFVGGYCMGGNIAYEIAQLLARQGKAVGLVAMLDTFNLRKSQYTGSALARFRIWLQKSGFHLNTLVHLSMAERRVYVAEKMRMARELLHGKGQAWLSPRPAPNEAEDAGGRIVTFVQNANHIALTRHDPQPYAGDVALFRPRKNYYTFRDPQMGWGDLVQGRLESIVVTANPHAMLIEPFVKKLAEELKRRIVVPAADKSPPVT